MTWRIRPATHGLESLETGDDEADAPMRAVNARLGYVAMPDLLGVRGPLAGGVPSSAAP